MRFKIEMCVINGNKIDFDYRRKFLSIIKNGIKEESIELFNKYFNKNENKLKLYTWAVNFKNCNIKKDGIHLKENKIFLKKY